MMHSCQMMSLRRSILVLLFTIQTLVSRAQVREYPYPTLPDSLKTTTERGSYLLLHYWDEIDFNDTLLVRDENIGEQGFVNYIDLIPRITEIMRMIETRNMISTDCPAVVKESVARFVKKAMCSMSKTFFEKMIDHYLDDPNSPLRNDKTYALMLEAQLAQMSVTSKDADVTARERLTYKLRNVRKNQEGTVATNFIFVDRQGKQHQLRDYKDTPVVLYFYDPDCENCHKITAMLSKEETLKTITVLAIYPDEDEANWRQKPQPYPENWIDGYSPEGEITTQSLYYIQATPSIYLLDADNKIVLKDTDPDRLIEKIKHRIQL